MSKQQQMTFVKQNIIQTIKMFDFLKKPTHHHYKLQKTDQLPQQSQTLSPPSKYKETIEFKVIPKFINHNIQKNKQKKPARVKKYQESSEVHLTKQVEDKLKDLLLEAKDSVLNLKANQMIDKEMKERQQTAFIRYTSENQHQYLDKLYQKTIVEDQNLKFGLSDIISKTIDCISDDIENNMYDSQVFKKKLLSKEQLRQAEQLNQINLIKLKQGQISSKVGQLKMQINFVQNPIVISKAKQILEKQTYSKDDERTKEIQKFIEMKKKQREQIQLRKKQQIQRQKIKEIQQKVAKQKELQRAKTQKHVKLIEKLQAKQIQKQKKQQQIQNQKRKFAHFLQEYRNTKPLYQKKIQQQIQRQILEKKLRFQKMSQRKGKFNPISFSDIEDFQQKYLELKREQEEKKKIEMLIKKDQEKFRIQQMKDKHYKGKYRYLVLEQMVNKEAKNKEEQFAKKLLIQKKRAYSVDIKEKYKPRIDENKRMEMQRFVSKTERKRKQKGPRRMRINSSDPYDLETINYEEQEEKQEKRDPKKQGEKNMRLFKQYIHEKIKRGQIKRPETFQSRVSTLAPRIDYLKEQRENRQTINSSFAHQSLDSSSRIKKIKSQAKGDLSIFKLKAQQLDQKAKRQQLKLKYSQHTPNDQKQLEQNYLASIQTKLQILNNIS